MRILTTIFLGLLGLTTFGQTQNAIIERYIEVTGVGEVLVDPNLIYLSIELREYKKDGKIVKLEDLEGQLTKILQTVAIPTDNLKVSTSSGRQYDLKKRKADLLISKRYKLKLTDVDLLNPLLGELSQANIFSVKVDEVTHSDIDKYKTEAKVKAINDAKEKALLLTTTMGGKLGQVLVIIETESLNYRAGSLLRIPGGAWSPNSDGSEDKDNNVDFEQMKLRYSIVVKFGIE